MVYPAQAVKNQVILVTGATDGLGKQVARDLAAQEATILPHGRRREKGETTLQEIRDATGNQKLIYYNAGFSSLDAWEESPYYSDRERAALAWAEAVTRASEIHVPDEVYEEAKKHFSEKELADLTLAVAAINTWGIAWPLRLGPPQGPISRSRGK